MYTLFVTSTSCFGSLFGSLGVRSARTAVLFCRWAFFVTATPCFGSLLGSSGVRNAVLFCGRALLYGSHTNNNTHCMTVRASSIDMTMVVTRSQSVGIWNVAGTECEIGVHNECACSIKGQQGAREATNFFSVLFFACAVQILSQGTFFSDKRFFLTQYKTQRPRQRVSRILARST